MKKDSIMLTAAQRRSLEQVISRGKSSAWIITHAQVLLKVDRSPLGLGWSTSQIIEAFSVSRSTVERVCKRFREQGLDGALFRRPQPPRPQKRKLDGEAEAHLVVLLCGQKPEGAERRNQQQAKFPGVLPLPMPASSSSVSIRQSKLDRALWGPDLLCPPPIMHIDELIRPSRAQLCPHLLFNLHYRPALVNHPEG